MALSMDADIMAPSMHTVPWHSTCTIMVPLLMAQAHPCDGTTSICMCTCTMAMAQSTMFAHQYHAWHPASRQVPCMALSMHISIMARLSMHTSAMYGIQHAHRYHGTQHIDKQVPWAIYTYLCGHSCISPDITHVVMMTFIKLTKPMHALLCEYGCMAWRLR